MVSIDDDEYPICITLDETPSLSDRLQRVWEILEKGKQASQNASKVITNEEKRKATRAMAHLKVIVKEECSSWGKTLSFGKKSPKEEKSDSLNDTLPSEEKSWDKKVL